ncbi:chloride channel protein [Flavobacterium sp. HSC-61S13]|uniref:chloride channel protein n=1 Tax=Flavobacterium sp. HSC-61S13 TaxID=2910963 RepID=UPI00209D2767|nr:chloride channel protein [Flavobacterium sp. HSC-61S13]MCP1995967.1 H+/Cl- antiporter ClcA [Flavobacterium sp. HSC-61S13]
MMNFSLNSKAKFQNILSVFLAFLLKWVTLAVVIGVLIGSSSALFLYLLDRVTSYRSLHNNLVFLLPFAGLFIGLLYHYFGKSVSGGNHLLVQEYGAPKAIIPLKMAPLILVGTLITHLFGGSAGREGTAVQIGGSIADQFSRLFHLDSTHRKLLIAIGISAGFAAVFGTPWAGTLFAIEILVVGSLRYKTFLLCMISAFVANFTCEWWSIQHTAYQITDLPNFTASIFFITIGSGVLFGLIALVFMKGTSQWNAAFKKYISYPPLRPFIGGLLFLILYISIGDVKYLGLGIPTIVESFEHTQGFEVFLLKILFTSLTLGSGFKGGEVTPLFFIGAALGSFLSIYFAASTSFLAALGFVAVFSGATKTPWASSLMGIELFGIESGLFLLLACWLSATFSGPQNLYNSPPHPQLSKFYKKLYDWWKKNNLIQSSNR